MPATTIEQFISAKPEQVYFHFTNATAMREWLCDLATVSPRPGGRLYFYWNAGYYVAGEFIDVDPERSLSFKWIGRDEPGATTVSVTFTRQNDGTQVKLTHEIPDGPQWEGMLDGFREEWGVSLENLAYLLETGKDLRTVNRPMLGIIPGDFNSEQANRLRVPTSSGMRLDGVVDGMGAQAAGLQRDDVLISMAGKPVTNDFSSLPATLAGKRGGDKVEVVFYRGPEKRTVIMELSRRQMPIVPWNPAELALLAREKYKESLTDLFGMFKGASEEQTAKRPAPREWSAQEVLAHLIHSERGFHSHMDDLVGGFEQWADDWGGNIEARLKATIAAYGTTAAMLEELNRLCKETLVFIENLPPEFVADKKGSYYNLGAQIAQGNTHIDGHLDQIKAALTAAK